MRSTAHLCPVPGCGNHRLRWQAVCRACWGRLPADLSGAIVAAKRDKAPHLVGFAVIRAMAWLSAHPPGWDVARIIGERT